jgi:hypothetical protein
MAKEGPAPTMRDDDQRQPLARNWAILGDRQNIRTDCHLACDLSTRIPDRSFEGLKRPTGRNLDALEAAACPRGATKQKTRERRGNGLRSLSMLSWLPRGALARARQEWHSPRLSVPVQGNCASAGLPPREPRAGVRKGRVRPFAHLPDRSGHGSNGARSGCSSDGRACWASRDHLA